MADMDASLPSLPALTEMPAPQFVMAADGIRIATYLWGDDDAPTCSACTASRRAAATTG